MKLNINKPLVIFDLETTGLDMVKDRIIQLSYIKVTPNGEEKRVNLTINPEMEIPKFVTELTGISNADVADKPTFKQIASQLAEEFKGSDLAGYNSNNFDVPMLCEEFLRAGIDFDFSKCRLIDAMAIFRKQERRNLAAAYKFYCGRKMEDDFEAHRAQRDAGRLFVPHRSPAPFRHPSLTLSRGGRNGCRQCRLHLQHLQRQQSRTGTPEP